MRKIAIGAGMAMLAGPAAADVVAATPAGFEVRQTVTIDAPIAAVWEALRNPQRWWLKDHTVSGDSANLYLDQQATGCFCEKLADRGSVEHARIVAFQPRHMIRLQGALGPLQAEAAIGTLTFQLDPDGDSATKVSFDYVVGGYIRDGADGLGPRLDEVLGQQLSALKILAEAPAAAVDAGAGKSKN